MVVWVFFSGNTVSVYGQAAITSGYFLTEKGSDTIRGRMIVPLAYASQSPAIHLLQWHAVFIDDQGHELVLNPKHITAYGFRYNEKIFDFISCENSLNIKNPFEMQQEKVFLNVVVNGYVDMFIVHMLRREAGNRTYGASSPDFTHYMQHYFLRNESGQYDEIRGFSFKKCLISYFSDYAEMKTLLKEKPVNQQNLDFYVRAYNRWMTSR